MKIFEKNKNKKELEDLKYVRLTWIWVRVRLHPGLAVFDKRAGKFWSMRDCVVRHEMRTVGFPGNHVTRWDSALKSRTPCTEKL